MARYSKDTIDKIGNSIIYICQAVPSLNKTKLLKLLYLLEESSAQMFHTPFFGIEFKTWRFGPVAPEVFTDLSGDLSSPMMLKDYIELEFGIGETLVKPKREFDDGEFSDNDIAVLDSVLSQYGQKTAETLVKYLHKRGSAWDIAARENGLHELFNDGVTNTSDVSVDVTRFVSDEGKSRYNSTRETWDVMTNYKK
jgi:uncharacterized phage-associated protein